VPSRDMAGVHEEGPNFIWQDREIRFDAKVGLLNPRKGEAQIDSINSVEDTKGNNGERGSLIVTNLRIIWVSHANSSVNLSIGLGTVLTANIRKAKSKLRGQTQALCVMARWNSKFEFIFTSLVKNSPRLFTTIQAVMRAYETSKLYRDLKLRGSVINNGELIMLPQEQVYSKIEGVWNLSSDQGNLGVFYFTNVRVVWHAEMAKNFNISLPYMQVKSLKMRDSKFGKALVLEAYKRSGGYILGFRMDPLSRLEEVFRELTKLYALFSTNPNFGVDFVLEAETPALQQLLQPRVEEDAEIIEDHQDTRAVAAYYAEVSDDGGGEADGGVGGDGAGAGGVSLDPRLGLAVESLAEGLSTQQLWNVLV
jgi:Bardet-Biedl syndrome 5 protein